MEHRNGKSHTSVVEPLGDARFRSLACARRPALLAELWQLMRHGRKWWLLPILSALFLLAGLLVLSAALGPAAPFIYPLF